MSPSEPFDTPECPIGGRCLTAAVARKGDAARRVNTDGLEPQGNSSFIVCWMFTVFLVLLYVVLVFYSFSDGKDSDFFYCFGFMSISFRLRAEKRRGPLSPLLPRKKNHAQKITMLSAILGLHLKGVIY